MAIGKTEKQEVIKKFGKDVKDTGSASVQIGIFSTRINEITEHLKMHKKDKHSRLGLIKLVSKRKKLLSYLKRTNEEQYGNITKDLKIRV
ncbi:MAG: 30S ribosomal protein S15 [Candidatus Omnitrophota bacterium]|nr:30S ribosomal protein S15 [Candidatus Omnitrophota bacterium]MBU2528350.1 30S ribosomal protein S15 [bacterium]MBU3930604.1 30S ribosomal protein S15 [bacterium]MBU4122590.1 30S ribosomal protein S15 [bacterium]